MTNEYTYTHPMPAHLFIERWLIGDMLQQLNYHCWTPESFDDGGGPVPFEGAPFSNIAEAVWAAFTATDGGNLFVRHIAEGSRGWIRLVGGNGEDVISDYSMNLEPVMQKVFLR